MDNQSVASQLAALHTQCFENPWPETSFQELLASDFVRPVLFSEEGEPAGLGLIRTVSDEAEILTLGVVPAFRRTGLGRALVETLVSMAEMEGAKRLFLEVSDRNIAARRLYESCGFHQAGQRAGYYSDGSDAIILVRALAPEEP